MGRRYSIERWREDYAPNPAMLRLLLAREGYRVFQWHDAPGTIYGSHKHDEDQSHWVVSGRLEITVETQGTYVLCAGDRDHLPADNYHTARVLGDDPVFYIVGSKIEAVQTISTGPDVAEIQEMIASQIVAKPKARSRSKASAKKAAPRKAKSKKKGNARKAKAKVEPQDEEAEDLAKVNDLIRIFEKFL
jgi:quercetin dioxygenase-like cupin family protein